MKAKAFFTVAPWQLLLSIASAATLRPHGQLHTPNKLDTTLLHNHCSGRAAMIADTREGSTPPSQGSFWRLRCGHNSSSTEIYRKFGMTRCSVTGIVASTMESCTQSCECEWTIPQPGKTWHLDCGYFELNDHCSRSGTKCDDDGLIYTQTEVCRSNCLCTRQISLATLAARSTVSQLSLPSGSSASEATGKATGGQPAADENDPNKPTNKTNSGKNTHRPFPLNPPPHETNADKETETSFHEQTDKTATQKRAADDTVDGVPTNKNSTDSSVADEKRPNGCSSPDGKKTSKTGDNVSSGIPSREGGKFCNSTDSAWKCRFYGCKIIDYLQSVPEDYCGSHCRCFESRAEGVINGFAYGSPNQV